MNDEIYNDIAIEQLAQKHFKTRFEIKQMIIGDVPVGRAANAFVFLTENSQLYVLIRAETPLILDDVRKIINRMGMTADAFLPPQGNAMYFDDYGRERFKTVFPGRTPSSAADLRYYRQLAPYNPALVRIASVKSGAIYQFDPGSTHEWRIASRFSYRKISTL